MKCYWLICLPLALCRLTFPAHAQTLPAGGIAATTAPATQPEQPVPEDAEKAIAEKRYAEAVRILEPLAAPESAGYAVLLKLAGAYDALALETPTARDVETRRRFGEYCRKAAQTYLRAGLAAQQARNPAAQTIFLRALRYDPANPAVLLVLARMSRDSGSNVQAAHYYKQYIKTSDGQRDFEGQVELGRLLVAQGLWRQAVEVLEKARAVGRAEAERELAQAYLAGQQPEKAIDAINRAIEQDPNAPASFLIRASMVVNLGIAPTLKGAVGDLKTALRLSFEALAAAPEDDQVWQRAQMVFENSGKVANAIRLMARQKPLLDSDDYIALADVIAARGDLQRRIHEQEAAHTLSDVVKAAPPDSVPIPLLEDLARRQRHLGQANAAIQTAERILVRAPQNELARQIKDSGGKPGAP